MDKALIERIRSGLATANDFAMTKGADVLAIKRDTGVPQFRFFAEKSFGVVKDQRQVLGVPHSTEGVDRMGDIIRVKGWQLDNYRKNPVLLFGHDSESLPVAKALKVRKGQSASGLKSLLIDEQYHEADLNPQSELIWRMVEAGALPGRSVGFLPIETYSPESEEERVKLGLGKYGIEFREQELLESSIVPVPANAEALQGKCYAIAQATAKQAVEDGVATWSDVQRLAGILPITDEDAARINRERRRSTVSLAGLPEIEHDVPNAVDAPIDPEEVEELKADIAALEEDRATVLYSLAELEVENEQLRDQVADLTRAIGVLSRTAEDRSERAGQEPERRSNDEPEVSFYDTLLDKVEQRRQERRFGEELARRVQARLGSGSSPKE